MTKPFLAPCGVALVALLLAACAPDVPMTAEAKDAYHAGRPAFSGRSTASDGREFDLYVWKVDGTNLYIVPGASVVWTRSCGKSCTKTEQTISPAEGASPANRREALAALRKLTPQERDAIGVEAMYRAFGGY